MSITTLNATNMALQYNNEFEITLTDYLINDSRTNGRFLTEAPLTRVMRGGENVALYFLCDDTSFVGAILYEYYDQSGVLISSELLSASWIQHNSVPVLYGTVPPDTYRVCVKIISSTQRVSNADFTQGTGNLFTGWTLTQPSRTNYIIRSQEFDNASWVKANITVTPNTHISYDGTLTADTLTEAAVNSSFHTDSATTTVVNGNTYTMSVYAKSNGRRYVLLYEGFSDIGVFFDLENGTALGSLGAGTLLDSSIKPAPNGYYLLSVTYVQSGTSASLQMYLSNNGTGVAYNGDGTSGIIVSDAQLEDGSYLTPRIITTNLSVTTPVGNVIQDATGGVGGSRALLLWSTNEEETTEISQSITLILNKPYFVQVYAKNYEEGINMNLLISFGAAPEIIPLTDELIPHNLTLNGTATGANTLTITADGVSYAGYGFALIDKILVFDSDYTLISEVRCFKIDQRCADNERELNWLNKLGGRDTFVFTGFPIDEKSVQRNNLIENSKRTNFQSPNRIYGYRENLSKKNVSLFTRCPDEATAIWLRDELIDSIDVLILVGDYYYPVNVLDSTIVTDNKFRKDFTVQIKVQYAFDVNIQTR